MVIEMVMAKVTMMMLTMTITMMGVMMMTMVRVMTMMMMMMMRAGNVIPLWFRLIDDWRLKRAITNFNIITSIGIIPRRL